MLEYGMSSLPLERWLTHLLAVWRDGSGPLDGLTAAEAHSVASGVKELSRGLTGARDLAGKRYLARSDLLGAYLLYFWPSSFAQTLWALRRAGVRPGNRALDLGSGPAPGAFALMEAGWNHVSAADRSPEALETAARLAHRAGRPLQTLNWEAGNPIPQGPWDLIVAGHLLNEIGAGAADRIERRVALMRQLADQLSADGKVLVIEPASHGPNVDALTLRDALVSQGWSVSGPCFFQGACPALAVGAACHDVLNWKVPHLVAQIARRAGIDKRTLPFTWLSFRPHAAAAAEPSLVRVVSEPLLNKAGRRRVVVCGTAGRFSLSAPGAYRSPAWLAVARGQALRVDQPEARESGWGIGPATRVGPA